MSYRVPIKDIEFAVRRIGGLDDGLSAGSFPGLSDDLVESVLSEAARFAESEIAPIDGAADKEGAHFANGEVTTPKGFKEAYAAYVEAGWAAVGSSAEFGGQGLPILIHTALQEMMNGGSPSFSVGVMLTGGAAHAIEEFGSTELKRRYLPKLVSGEWTATMNLTEPHAGSDLGAMRTRAEPVGDGSFRIFGQKIFITYGEHDLAENIIHLVLARTTGAPEGTRGISLFLVPKFLPKPDGTPGERNDLLCAGIEEKLGLHGSPTCTMIYGDGGKGAIGWLVGEENRGLNAMFLMMNRARLTVGIQGVAVAERAYQQALAYAHIRRQGRAPDPKTGGMQKGGGMSLIVEHPDVQRNLLTMRSLTAAARALCYACAGAVDRSLSGPESERAAAADEAGLLTPVAKAFATDVGVEVASLGVQVHGGAGYIEETGAAQLYRDARIFPIYEGTNGIQALDLVTRRLPLGGGAVAMRFMARLDELVAAVRASNNPAFGRTAEKLEGALGELKTASMHLGGLLAAGKLAAAFAGATPYLRLFALTAGGTLIAGAAAGAPADVGSAERIALSRFFAESLLGEAAALRERVVEGSESLAAAAQFLTSELQP